MKDNVTRLPQNGTSLLNDDPVLKRLNAVERMLGQLLKQMPTHAQLAALVNARFESVYAAKFRELDDLRTECVRLLAVLRDQAKQSPPVSQETLNGD